MARETIKFKTPVDKHEVEIYSYLTGGEADQIEDAIIDDVEMDIGSINDVDEKKLAGKFKGSGVRKSADKTLELALVSVNGEKGDLVKKVKDFRQKDYQIVVEKIRKINEDETDNTKKNEEGK